MTYTEIRPYPVPATVVMRGTLFALATKGAKLAVYNEETGVIVATLSTRMGLKKNDIIVRVRPFADTSQLELNAADAEQSYEIIQLISAYVTDGSKVEANANIQWIDMQKQQAGRIKRRQLINKARHLLPGQSSPTPSPETAVTTTDSTPSDDNALVEMASIPETPIPIPDNPGVLVKNQQDRIIELKINPEVFSDRSAYLMVCQGCGSTIMKGSAYCSHCARPLTLEAVQPELRSNAQKTASSSLRYSLAAIALNLVPILILLLPLALTAESTDSFLDAFATSLTSLKLGVSLVCGIAPSIFLGWRGIVLGQRANWYRNLRAVTDNAGASQAAIGSALGWLAIYAGAAWVIFMLIALFL
ncbi:MAG: hypothetical protein CSA11_04960 [Chloroflexi bacterium]|nr:MAG: hypothetical protein CSB13_01660 [Chloroflexota bacterium]PIE81347.1 MAG: hypothetical protein CSA11_04960 [Chloroflexota bacterium]